VMRAGALRGLVADVAQVAVVNVLVTHARVPDATVRDLVAAILANAGELGRRNPLFVGLADLFEPLRGLGRVRSNLVGSSSIRVRLRRIAMPACLPDIDHPCL